MPQTLTVITAAIGGHAGATPTEVVDAARGHLATVVTAGLLTDAHAYPVDGTLALLLSHDRGERDAEVHAAGWEALVAASDVAVRLHGAGSDLRTDAVPANIADGGPAVAELTLNERPSESLVVTITSAGGAGALNLPLARAFADPFNTPGLVLTEALHTGFSFEVHDLLERRKIMFITPEETYDLLAFAGSSSRYAIKRIATRESGEVAAASSAHPSTASTSAAAIVRCHGGYPTVGETLEPFTLPQLLPGGERGTHLAPWRPTALASAHGARFDGPSSVVALGFQLTDGMLGAPRDLFADPAFDAARAEAERVADVLRRHGPFEPHRLPLDEMEQAAVPAVAARLASRWSEL